MNAHELSRGLGFSSITLGLAELLAPRKLAAAVGIHDDHDTLIRGLGARELASGLAILSGLRTKESVWSRVAGAAIDLGLMSAAFTSQRTDRQKLAAGMLAVASVTALDIATSLALTRGPEIDPSWRYSPTSNRSGLPSGPASVISTSAETSVEPHASADPVAQPIELAQAPETAAPLR
jgi:hypothetical protein